MNDRMQEVFGRFADRIVWYSGEYDVSDAELREYCAGILGIMYDMGKKHGRKETK